MKQDQKIVWTIEKEDRVYRLEVPANANLGEAYHVVGDFLKFITDAIEEHAKARKEAIEEAKKNDEVKDGQVSEGTKDV